MLAITLGIFIGIIIAIGFFIAAHFYRDLMPVLVIHQPLPFCRFQDRKDERA